jgi:heme oxygenase
MRTRILDMLQLETQLQCNAVQARALALVDGTRDGYREYLVRAYGFEAPLESACGMTPLLASHSATGRPRTRYIAHDLADLGVPLERLLELDQYPLPPFRDVCQGLGWLYVAERNVITNSLCHRQLAVRDPVLASRAQYLNCYGSATAAHWRAFGISLERAAATVDPERVVTAAAESFDELRRWLTN